MEREVTVTVDGKEVPLNDFVAEMTEGLVRALAKPLKGVDPDGEITIKVGPVEKK
ncbi:MAG: hypothetical protein ACLFNZ_07930 [Spirochaetaceae bacterium]